VKEKKPLLNLHLSLDNLHTKIKSNENTKVINIHRDQKIKGRSNFQHPVHSLNNSIIAQSRQLLPKDSSSQENSVVSATLLSAKKSKPKRPIELKKEGFGFDHIIHSISNQSSPKVLQIPNPEEKEQKKFLLENIASKDNSGVTEVQDTPQKMKKAHSEKQLVGVEKQIHLERMRMLLEEKVKERRKLYDDIMTNSIRDDVSNIRKDLLQFMALRNMNNDSLVPQKKKPVKTPVKVVEESDTE